jgi:hypothetical protein
MDYQFYPTPLPLAKRMWSKFSNARNFERVLDPSGGNGDLFKGSPWEADRHSHWRVRPKMDACEIDVSRHEALRKAGTNVVGLDFLQFQSCAIYSAIIMNPPFASGVHHVLHAWDKLYDGEIVALVNAETIKNPCSKERERLVDLVMAYGDIEFIEGAFQSVEAERKTTVSVAIIHLTKVADTAALAGNYFDDCQENQQDEDSLVKGYEAANQLSIPANGIENAVRTFNAAVRAKREAVFTAARADYYSILLGQTMAERQAGNSLKAPQSSVEFVKKTLGAEYDKLKDAAWAGVLRGADFKQRLSSKAQQRVESQFDHIKKLEFTVSNVYGFLLGIIESQQDIQMGMICDVFDEITSYGTDNSAYYRGWKSNDKHRSCGRRIKMTRFVIPGNNTNFGRSLSWDAEQRLKDFDKVFALLDGKSIEAVQTQQSLSWACREKWDDLRCGERVATEYFDVRYYQGVGTMHFYPKDKMLIDRLNRIVGSMRGWLPPATQTVHKDFWVQYDKAEKFTEEYMKEVNKTRNQYGGAYRSLDPDRNGSPADLDRSRSAIDAAMRVVQERHEIDIEKRLESSNQPAHDQLLLAA